MSDVKPRTHVVLTGLDYERIEYGLKMYPAYRIYIVKNGYPKKEHEELVKEIDEQLLRIITEKLRYDKENVIFWPIDFYNFENALASIYELLLKETKEGREVIVNITSGTKPVALAACLAAALVKCGVIYFSAREYRRESGEVVSKGVIPEPIIIKPLFELAEIMLPNSEEEIDVILHLRKGKVRTVSEILTRKGKKPSKKEIARYTYYVNKLNKEKIVNIEKDGISLTALGNLVGMLLEKKIKIEKENTLSSCYDG